MHGTGLVRVSSVSAALAAIALWVSPSGQDTIDTAATELLDSLRTYHALGFFIIDTSRLAGSPILGKMHRTSRLAVTGVLKCTGWNGIQPTAIRVARSR
jgi:hypothetical protein